MKVEVSKEIESVCPIFVGAVVEANVENGRFCKGLWDEIHALCDEYKVRFTPQSVKEWLPVSATRTIYRRCGKDPSRYRPASEALIRRVLQGKELYQIDTLVDLINLASMRFGHSIGGFDADKFHGDKLELGIGKKDEPYEGIGRGPLNIEGLPVYRDADGGVGTPTSDHERTKIDLNTTHLLVLVNGYEGDEGQVVENARYIQDLLRKYCYSDGGTLAVYK